MDEHVFWLQHYPRSINGIIDYLSNDNKVYCICCDSSLFENRSNMGWKVENFENVDFIFLDKVSNVDDFLIQFVVAHNKAIHYIMGVRYGKISYYVKQFLFTSSVRGVFMIAERPFLYRKNFISVMALRGYYRYLGLKYSKKIQGVFAMGTLGVSEYKNWASNNVFPFVYPHFNSIPQNDKTIHNSCLKLLYVGQLDERKGIDLLIDCVSCYNEKVVLDIYGNNGNIMHKTICDIDSFDNINYKGVCDSAEVVDVASGYDVCIVPSRYDGWGMFVMEAIEAGVGVITTDTTGAKDLVIYSGAGMVVKAGEKQEIQKAIDFVLKNPILVDIWKNKAKNYRHKISKKSVGDYFLQCVKISLDDNNEKIHCPWL